MQFSNTDTRNGLIQRYERHTQLGDGVVSGDDGILKHATNDINEVIYDITTEIIAHDDNFEWDDPYKTDYPIATTPLIANQRDYQFDNISFLNLKRVDITWDGTNWYRATPFDSGAYKDGFGNDEKVDGNFNKTEPKYDPKGFGFWLYPRATADELAAGAKARIEYQRAYDEFVYTDTIKNPPIDRPFHDLIAVGAAIKNPSITPDQYQKLTLIFGQKMPNGEWTGGMASLLRHYGRRNEDDQLVFNPQIQDYS